MFIDEKYISILISLLALMLSILNIASTLFSKHTDVCMKLSEQIMISYEKINDDKGEVDYDGYKKRVIIFMNYCEWSSLYLSSFPQCVINILSMQSRHLKKEIISRFRQSIVHKETRDLFKEIFSQNSCYEGLISLLSNRSYTIRFFSNDKSIYARIMND